MKDKHRPESKRYIRDVDVNNKGLLKERGEVTVNISFLIVFPHFNGA